jgi:hypothetical protein
MHPYKLFPSRQFWSQAVTNVPWSDVFAPEQGKFAITRDKHVVSAGSCFAQRISRHLMSKGYDYARYESLPSFIPLATQEELGYHTFSCRYGNIYTLKQLRQLIDQALGTVPTVNLFDRNKNGVVLDLLRPNLNKVGFESFDHAAADRKYHLTRVAKMFTEADVFVLTLGLTEAWLDRRSGVVYGTHPSVATGLPTDQEVEAVNFDYAECVADLTYVRDVLKELNPKLEIVLTVSPVGLVATHQPNHILISSTYSKSVLRAVAGKVCEENPRIDYFPSFEIFNLSQSQGQFLSADLRDVNMQGVAVAMSLFEKMFLGSSGLKDDVAPQRRAVPDSREYNPAPVDVECDEIMNQVFTPTSIASQGAR